MRERIYAHIEANPGTTTSDLQRITGIGRTAVLHHTRKLQRMKRIGEKKYGRCLHYFPAHQGLVRADHIQVASKHAPARRRVFEAIQLVPGSKLTTIAQNCGMGDAGAHFQVKKLIEAGLVTSIRTGRTVALYAKA